MKSIEIDRSKRLKEEPHKGHNRWHPDIPPVLEASVCWRRVMLRTNKFSRIWALRT